VLKGDGGIDYLLGIAPTGLVIYRNRTKIVSHFWSVDVFVLMIPLVSIITTVWLAVWQFLSLFWW